MPVTRVGSHRRRGRAFGNRAAIRWYELRKTTGNWAIQNQGTFGPSDGLYRSMGSAAMDKDGNLAVGYSIENGTAPNYPSIRTRADSSATRRTGSAKARRCARRDGLPDRQLECWGDYSMMTTHPVDDCTFWYHPVPADDGPNPVKTRIGSFKFPTCGWATASATSAASASPPPPPPPRLRLASACTASASPPPPPRLCLASPAPPLTPLPLRHRPRPAAACHACSRWVVSGEAEDPARHSVWAASGSDRSRRFSVAGTRAQACDDVASR